MAKESWKIPLDEIADPFRLKKWAVMANDADISIELTSIVAAKSFADGYVALMRSQSYLPHFAEANKADGLASQGLSAFGEPAVNVVVLTEAMDYCRKRASLSRTSAKKEAWGKVLSHIGSWCSAFSSNARQLLSAAVVDHVLASEAGPISIDEAEERVRSECGDSLHDIVWWYLQTIRVKYRKDITIAGPNEGSIVDNQQDVRIQPVKCLFKADNIRLKDWCGSDSMTNVLVVIAINIIEALQKGAAKEKDFCAGEQWKHLLEWFCNKTCENA